MVGNLVETMDGILEENLMLLDIDEAEVYDRLAILMVKESCGALPVSGQVSTLIKKLDRHIGESANIVILASPEMTKLIAVNTMIFERLNKIRRGFKIDAKVIDDMNLARFDLKRALQTKFFKRELQELKTFHG